MKYSSIARCVIGLLVLLSLAGAAAGATNGKPVLSLKALSRPQLRDLRTGTRGPLPSNLVLVSEHDAGTIAHTLETQLLLEQASELGTRSRWTTQQAESAFEVLTTLQNGGSLSPEEYASQPISNAVPRLDCLLRTYMPENDEVVRKSDHLRLASAFEVWDLVTKSLKNRTFRGFPDLVAHIAEAYGVAVPKPWVEAMFEQAVDEEPPTPIQSPSPFRLHSNLSTPRSTGRFNPRTPSSLPRISDTSPFVRELQESGRRRGNTKRTIRTEMRGVFKGAAKEISALRDKSAKDITALADKCNDRLEKINENDALEEAAIRADILQAAAMDGSVPPPEQNYLADGTSTSENWESPLPDHGQPNGASNPDNHPQSNVASIPKSEEEKEEDADTALARKMQDMEYASARQEAEQRRRDFHQDQDDSDSDSDDEDRKPAAEPRPSPSPFHQDRDDSDSDSDDEDRKPAAEPRPSPSPQPKSRPLPPPPNHHVDDEEHVASPKMAPLSSSEPPQAVSLPPSPDFDVEYAHCKHSMKDMSAEAKGEAEDKDLQVEEEKTFSCGTCGGPMKGDQGYCTNLVPVENIPGATKVCGGARPLPEGGYEGWSGTDMSAYILSKGDWRCDCGVKNEGSATSCIACQAPQRGQKGSSSPDASHVPTVCPFTSGNTPVGGFGTTTTQVGGFTFGNTFVTNPSVGDIIPQAGFTFGGTFVSTSPILEAPAPPPPATNPFANLWTESGQSSTELNQFSFEAPAPQPGTTFDFGDSISSNPSQEAPAPAPFANLWGGSASPSASETNIFSVEAPAPQPGTTLNGNSEQTENGGVFAVDHENNIEDPSESEEGTTKVDDDDEEKVYRESDGVPLESFLDLSVGASILVFVGGLWLRATVVSVRITRRTTTLTYLIKGAKAVQMCCKTTMVRLFRGA